MKLPISKYSLEKLKDDVDNIVNKKVYSTIVVFTQEELDKLKDKYGESKKDYIVSIKAF